MNKSVVNEITRTIMNGPTPTAPEAFDALRIWGEQIFGHGSPSAIIARVKKEMVELERELDVKDEWTDKALEEAADVLGVLTRVPGLWEALIKKMNVNFDREWQLHGDGTGSHIPKEG